MQSFIGFDDAALRFNRSYTITDEPLKITSNPNAYVSPIWPSVEGNFLEELAGGAFDERGRFLAAAAQPRSDGHNAVLTNQIVTIPSHLAGRLEKAVFGGIAFDHFGHFLLEASARLWCRDEYKTLPWLFLTDGRPEMKRYQRDFLMVLGLAEEQIISVSDWLEIGELIIPEPSFVYHHHVAHGYRDTFRKAPLAPQDGAGRRVFLSRVNTTLALTVGEKELEDVLAQNGWDIVYPETLPAQAQAAIFRDDNIVLGLQGSAMHLGLFAPEHRRVVHLCRGLGYRGYYILDDLMNADATYFNAMRSHELPSKPIRGPFLLDLDRSLGFLREQGLIAGAAHGMASLPDAGRDNLDTEYAAWWHFTESQIRFHHQLADDGSSVPQLSALASALQAAELSPENRTILCHAAALLLKFEGAVSANALLEQHGAAITYAQTAEDAQLLYYISLIRDEFQDYDAAVKAGAAAVAYAPDDPAYVNQLAIVLFRLHRLDEAEALLLGLIERGYAVAGNYFVMSLIARQRQDEAAALHWARLAVKTDRNDAGVCRHLANLLVANHHEREALTTYLEFLERHPSHAGMALDACTLAQRLNENEVVLPVLLTAYQGDPDHADIAGKCLEILKERRQLPNLEGLDEMPPPAIQEQSIMIYRRSVALAEEGALAKALQVAMIAAELYPANETIMGNLLGLMIRSARIAEAHLLAKLVLQKGHMSPAVFYVLSLVESAFGRKGEAQTAALRAFELAPENDEIAGHYSRFLAA